MREIRTSGLMSGDGKQSDADMAQATAPVPNSTMLAPECRPCAVSARDARLGGLEPALEVAQNHLIDACVCRRPAILSQSWGRFGIRVKRNHRTDLRPSRHLLRTAADAERRWAAPFRHIGVAYSSASMNLRRVQCTSHLKPSSELETAPLNPAQTALLFCFLRQLVALVMPRHQQQFLWPLLPAHHLAYWLKQRYCYQYLRVPDLFA